MKDEEANDLAEIAGAIDDVREELASLNSNIEKMNDILHLIAERV